MCRSNTNDISTRLIFSTSNLGVLPLLLDCRGTGSFGSQPHRMLQIGDCGDGALGDCWFNGSFADARAQPRPLPLHTPTLPLLLLPHSLQITMTLFCSLSQRRALGIHHVAPCQRCSRWREGATSHNTVPARKCCAPAPQK